MVADVIEDVCVIAVEGFDVCAAVDREPVEDSGGIGAAVGTEVGGGVDMPVACGP